MFPDSQIVKGLCLFFCQSEPILFYGYNNQFKILFYMKVYMNEYILRLIYFSFQG